MSNPEVKTITVDNVEYDIKDAKARTDIAGIENLSNSTFYNTLIDTLYPVGSLYISMNDSAPFSRGTWTKVGAGKALVGVDTASAVTAMRSAGGTFGQPNVVNVSHNHATNTFTTGAPSSNSTNSAGSHSHGFPSSYKVPAFQGTGSVEEIGSVGGTGYEIFQIARSGTWHTITATAAAGVHSHTLNNHTHSVSVSVSKAGEDGTNKNYQPSIAVYLWKRTA